MQIHSASLALLVVLAAMTVGAVASTGSNPPASTATEVEDCRVIDEPGRYVLTRDIHVEDRLKPYCIRITASNVTFDGNEHTIVGNYTRRKDYAEHDALQAESSGILVAGNATLSDVEVREVTVEDWKYGINVTDVTDSSVVGVRARNNRFRGVSLEDFDGGVVATSTVTGTHGTALLVSGDANVVRDNNLSDNDVRSKEFVGRGLRANGANNTVVGNELRDNAGIGSVDGTGGTVVNNTLGSTPFRVGATETRIADNTLADATLFVEGNATAVENNTLDESTLATSGTLIRVSDNRLRNSTITVGGDPLTDSTISGNSLENSSVVMNEDGLLLSVPVNNLTIRTNDVEHGSITLGRATNSTIRGNTVIGGESGLRLVGPLDGTVVEGNVLANNTDGIHVGTWSDLVVRHNDITNNSDGIHVAFSRFKGYDPPSDSSDASCPSDPRQNLSIAIYDNNFANNTAFGVHNTENSTVNATNNYWGASDGPSSNETDEDAPFEDPKTGALADGGGSAVSEGPEAGVSNVRFDPYHTFGGCASCT